MQDRKIREGKRLSSNLKIGFAFTWEKIDFQIKENLISRIKKLALSKS